MPQCLIGLGANLHQPEATIEAAIRMLDVPPLRLIRRSDIQQTQPVGPPGQSVYANAAACIETDMAALDLLDFLLQLENRLGRQRKQRWGPRQIDLDLLIHGSTIGVEGRGAWLGSPPRLVVPHPWLLVRRFAMEPAVQAAPNMIHPVLGATLKKIFFQTLGKVVAPTEVVVSVVGSHIDYRRNLSSLLAAQWQQRGFRGTESTAIGLEDPDAGVSELTRTPAREKIVEQAMRAGAAAVIAPFEVFQAPLSIMGVVDPDYLLYKDRTSSWAAAAQQRTWPYVMLSGELEEDLSLLTMACQSSQ